MEQGHCGACRRKWRLTDTDLCPCGETQMMSHIVESCPLTKLNGGLSQLHSADEDAVSWVISYGSWHAYEKKKKLPNDGHKASHGLSATAKLPVLVTHPSHVWSPHKGSSLWPRVQNLVLKNYWVPGLPDGENCMMLWYEFWLNSTAHCTA